MRMFIYLSIYLLSSCLTYPLRPKALRVTPEDAQDRTFWKSRIRAADREKRRRRCLTYPLYTLSDCCKWYVKAIEVMKTMYENEIIN